MTAYTYAKRRTDLVRLLSVLVFDLAFESISAIHVLGFMISPVDVHPVRVQPCTHGLVFFRVRVRPSLTYI